MRGSFHPAALIRSKRAAKIYGLAGKLNEPCSTNRLVRRAWDIGMRCPQRRRPALPQVVEIGLSRLNAIFKLGLAFVAAGHQDIKRQPDAQVRAHGRVDRYQADLERVVEIGAVGDGAVEHRLAVFVLADLQIGGVLRTFDEVAGRIEQKKPWPLAFDLATEQKRDVEFDIRCVERLALVGEDLSDSPSDALR